MGRGTDRVGAESRPPAEDSAAAHLPGRAMPRLALPLSGGGSVDLAQLPAGRTVIFLYPRMIAPGTQAPEGWDELPGARGCTAEACDFRDSASALRAAGVSLILGLSSQDTSAQREAAERLHLPFMLASDPAFDLATSLLLPTFAAPGISRLYRRLTLIVREGRIEHVFYPVFPPDTHARRLAAWLAENPVPRG